MSRHPTLIPNVDVKTASIYVAIQTNRYSARVGPEVTSAAEAAGFPSSDIPSLLQAIASGTADAIDSVPGITASIKEAVTSAVESAYSQSYATVYLSSLAFGGLALISCFFATNDLENYFTAFLNKTVDAPHLEADKKDIEHLKVAKGVDEP